MIGDDVREEIARAALRSQLWCCDACHDANVDEPESSYWQEALGAADAILPILTRREQELAALLGWQPFGTHAGDDPVPLVLFAGEDEAGMPLWERVVTADEQEAYQRGRAEAWDAGWIAGADDARKRQSITTNPYRRTDESGGAS